MTTVTSYYCPKCRKGLNFDLGYLKDGNLLADCYKCKKTVCLEQNVKCRECAKAATHFFTKGLSPVYPFYFCDEHFASYQKSRKRAKNKAKAIILPVIGTGLIIASFLDRSSSEPFVPFIMAGILCWVVAITSWKSRRTSSKGDSGEEDSDA